MVDEIIYQDIFENFEENGLSLKETELYLKEDINREEIISEIEGVFIPRKLKGFVRTTEDENELRRRYTHELGHGIFCENFPRGHTLVNLDKKMSKLEKEIYGEHLQSKIVNLPAKIEDTVEISEVEAEKIANKDLDNAEKYYLVNQETLEKYNQLRATLNQFYRQNIRLFEGFSLKCEEEIMGEVSFLEERPNIQIQGYKKLEDYSWSDLIRKLER